MFLYPGMSQDERIGNLWVNEKKMSGHILNRKADKKLDHVADLFCSIANERFISRKSEMLKKTLYFKDFRYIKHLHLDYFYENRVFALSYNLNYSTTFDAPESQMDLKACDFFVTTFGKSKFESARWHGEDCKCSEDEARQFLRMLNNKLIIDRIVQLDMTYIQLSYHPEKKQWTLKCKTLIGSTTWLLIPPVMSLIAPRPEECIKMLEFLELVADAVANNREDKVRS